MNYYPTDTLILETKDSAIPRYIEITPAVVHFDNKIVDYNVTLSNLSTNTINISPRSIIAELQPVDIEKSIRTEETSDEIYSNIFDLIHIGTDLTPEQDIQLRNLLAKHENIFSKHENDIGYCDLIKHRIDLSDSNPFKQRHRRIPPSMIEEIRKHLVQL